MYNANRDLRRFGMYLIFLTIASLFLICCSASQRFGKEGKEKESGSRYDNNKSIQR